MNGDSYRKRHSKGLKLDRFGVLGTSLGWIILKVTRISKINRHYESISHLEGIDFVNKVLELYGVRFEIPEEDLRRLPKKDLL